MDTIISKVDFAEPLKDIDVIEKAAEILQSGGLVAFLQKQYMDLVQTDLMLRR